MATGQEIYETFMAGNLSPLEAAEDLVMALAGEFEKEAQDLDDAQKELLSYWEGDSASKAGVGVDPLKQAHLQSAPMILDAGTSVRTQRDVYSWGKNSVEPVPPEPKEPSAWARGAAAILPGVDDPDVAYREGMARTDAANSNNVRVMDQYTNVTGDTSSKLPSDYGIVEDDGASISIGTHTSSAGGGPGIGSPGFGSSGLTPGGGAGGGVNLPGGGPTFGGGPGGGLPGGSPGSGPGPGPVPPGGVPGPGPAPGPRPGPIGIAPIGPVTGSPGEDSRRPARGGAGTRPPAGSSRAGARMSGGSQSGAGAGKASSVLRGGAAAQARLSGGTAGLQAGKGAGVMSGGGAGGAAAAAQARLSGGTAGLQAGKGAGVMSGGGAGGAAAAKAAGGIGGRAGAGGAGAAGAGGQRGQGAEDGEHKDKYAIKEELDDGLQVEFDELGAKTIDEKTGHTVVSPVIGEPGDGK